MCVCVCVCCIVLRYAASCTSILTNPPASGPPECIQLGWATGINGPCIESASPRAQRLTTSSSTLLLPSVLLSSVLLFSSRLFSSPPLLCSPLLHSSDLLSSSPQVV